MRTTHVSYQQQASVPSKSHRGLRVSRLAARIAMFLVAVVVPVQAGSTGVRCAAAADTCTLSWNVDVSGNRSTPANWSPLAATGPTDLELAAPANDDFANATALGSDAGALIGETNVDASVEAGEPVHDGHSGGRSVWYQWTPSVDGNAVIELTTPPSPDDWDSVLAVYTGSAVDALTEVIAKNTTLYSIKLEVRVVAGTTYHLAVDGYDSTDAGTFDLTWSIPSPSNDDFINATVLGADTGSLVAQHNVYASSEVGEPVHDGHSGGRSVWYKWTPSVDGNAVIELTTPPSPDDWDSVLAVYTGSAVDALTEVIAKNTTLYSIELEFGIVAGATYHLAIDGYDSTDTGTFDLTWTTEVPPLNDDFVNAVVLGGDTGSMMGATNKLATAEPGEPNHDGLATTPAHSVWYQWTPSVDAAASFVMTTPVSPDDWDSVLAVYTGTAVGALTEVAANRTAGTYLPLDFSVTGGTTYYLAVDGQASGQMGTFDLDWSVWPDDGYFIVTKTEDTDDGACDADCSLREAVVAANTTAGDDTIQLPAGIYQLTLDTYLAADHYGSLEVERETGTTSILGEGRDVTVIDATTLRTLGLNNPDRVFTVGYHAGLELVGVTVTGGYAGRGLSTEIDGGGIWNWNGYLTVTDCLIEGNAAAQGGGGIANHYGTATIINTIVRSNTTYIPDNSSYSNWGGGIQNTGTMTVTDCEISGNSTNPYGQGGGIANGGIIDIVDSTISGNYAAVGGGLSTDWAGTSSGDAWRATITSSALFNNTSDGDGGGIFTNATGILSPGEGNVTVTLIDTTVLGNVAEEGSGGGIYNCGSVVEIHRSTLNDNFSDFGGAVYNSDLHNAGATPGSVLISNSTLSGNGAVYGGAVSNADPGSTVLTNSTVTGNIAAIGGGIDNVGVDSTTLTLENTIIAGNGTVSPGSEDCSGNITSLGYNLVGDATGCPADAVGDVTTTDPMLSPLADFGGSTRTHALLPGSLAIDAGATDLSVDQRGILRPQGPADDTGAFEVEHGPNAPPVLEAVGDLTVDEGDTLDVMVTATDVDGDDLVLWVAGEPGFVSLTDHGDGTATLSLTPGFLDAGSYPGIAIAVSDAVDIDDEIITLEVIDVNAVPVADDQSVSTWQNTPVEITLTGSDADGDGLAYAIFEPPAHGDLSGTPPVVIYRPDSGFAGEDSFTFTVFDGDATSPPGTVAITVHNVRPDPTFGTDGTFISTFGGYGEAHAVAEQADGTILVAGWVRTDALPGLENANAVVAKLTPDGSLDSTFGAGGLATVAGRDNYFYDLVVEPDGQIVAVGQSKPDPVLSGDPLIARFDADGTLDTGFGTNGLVMPDLDGRAAAVALQPDGKIVVGGGFFGGLTDPHDLGAIRLLVNGDRDTTFGADGVTRVWNAGDDLVIGVAVQPDGAIVMAGTIDRFNEWGTQDMALVRLLPDGSLDPTFGDDGEARIDLGDAESSHGLALQPDGKILVVGDTLVPYDRDAIVVRTTSTGALDSSFGAGGVDNIPFGGAFEQFNDLVLQPDGTIVAAGSSGAVGTHDFIVARVLSDGSLDPTFDNDGKVTHDLGGDDAAWALAVQANGRLLLAGQKDADWAVLRLRATDTNQVPVLDSLEDQSLAEVDILDVGITAADADGDPLIFTLSGEPDFAALVDHGDGSATVNLTPGFDDAGVYPGVTVAVSDSFAADSKTFTITVSDTNQAPVLDAIGNQSVAEGGILSVTITARDLDDDCLSFGITGEPAFATLIDYGDFTATLRLTPGFDTAGVYPGVTVTVSDSVDTDSETFTITVIELYHIYLPLVLRN